MMGDPAARQVDPALVLDGAEHQDETMPGRRQRYVPLPPIPTGLEPVQTDTGRIGLPAERHRDRVRPGVRLAAGTAGSKLPGPVQQPPRPIAYGIRSRVVVHRVDRDRVICH
ncbi:hypothetical protein GCM10027613_25680 [Microlunatus endophyticus]